MRICLKYGSVNMGDGRQGSILKDGKFLRDEVAEFRKSFRKVRYSFDAD
jgi:hypothetical protein